VSPMEETFKALVEAAVRPLESKIDALLAAKSAAGAAPDAEQWNTLAQTAKKMQLSTRTLKTYIAKGVLRVSRPFPGARYAISDTEIDRCRKGLNAASSETPSRALSADDRALMLLNKKARR
jgi:hypothetical protein